MIERTLYDSSTGAINLRVQIPEPIPAPGESMIDGYFDASTQYIDVSANPPVVKDRPAQATVLNGTTLSGMPQPCQLHIDGQIFDVADGAADLSIEMPGTYQVLVRAFPYLDWTGEIAV